MPRRPEAVSGPRDPKGDQGVVVEQKRECARRIGLALIELGIAQTYMDKLPAARYGHTAETLRRWRSELQQAREQLSR